MRRKASFHSAMPRRMPRRSEEGVDVEGHGTNLTPGAEVDPRGEIGRARALFCGETDERHGQYADPRVGDACRGALLGKHRDRAPRTGRERFVLADDEDEILRRHAVGHVADDRGVVLAALHVAEQRAVGLVAGAGDVQRAHAAGFERFEVLVVAHEQRRVFDHHGRRIGVVGLDRVAGDNGHRRAELQRPGDAGVAVGERAARYLVHPHQRIPA